MSLSKNFCVLGVQGDTDVIPTHVRNSLLLAALQLYIDANETSNVADFMGDGFWWEITALLDIRSYEKTEGCYFSGFGKVSESAFEFFLILDLSVCRLSKEEFEKELLSLEKKPEVIELFGRKWHKQII